MKNKDQKVIIDYPCSWFYKVIGPDEEKMRAAIADVIDGAWEITASRSSAAGKYMALGIAVEVENEQVRKHIYEALRRHPSIIMVL